MGDAALHIFGRTGTFDDGGLVLGDNDLAGLSEHFDFGALELETNLLGDDLSAGQDRDVLQHRLATLTKAWGLNGH